MPGYADLHRALLNGIPFLPTRSFRVLELGVGTGTFTSLLLSEFPHAVVRGVDLSPKMIRLAREKLRGYRGRVELVASDLASYPSGEYDAVVSALAIHHLPDREKWRLFRQVHRSLLPGGYFGDADDHLPEDAIFDTRYAHVASVLAAGGPLTGSWTSPQEVWHEHEKFDHPCTVAAEVAALTRSGFAHVGNPWRFYGQAVIWAYK